MAYLLPFRPFVSPWTLGSSNLPKFERCLHRTNLPFGHFDSTSAYSAQRYRWQFQSTVDWSLVLPAPCLSSLALQHFRIQAPFFSLHLVERSVCITLHSESLALRVWLPSLRCQPLKSLEVSFIFQHSGALPFKAFFLLRGRMNSFEFSFPLLRFSTKPFQASYRRSNGLLPQRKPYS
jgi:hypothetical protein